MVLEGCSGIPTGPGNAPSLPTVNGTRTASGITLTIDSSSPLASVGSAALVQTPVGDFLVAHTGQDAVLCHDRDLHAPNVHDRWFP